MHQILALCGACLAAVAGCKSDPRAPGEAPARTQESTPEAAAPVSSTLPTELVWMTVDPQTLDPAKLNDMAAWWVSMNLFEGLLTPAPGNTPPVPGVAKALPTVSEDGRVWTFELRTDAKWSDGKPVVAEDFVYAWRRAVDPETGGKSGNDFRAIQGATAILEGSQKDLTALGVSAPDPHTLVVKLDHPHPAFDLKVASPAFFPVRRDVVEAHGDRWSLPEHIVSNGAYVLAEWKPRDRLVMTKNPHYWGAADVAIERTRMMHVEDENLGWNLYEDGKLHWFRALPAEKVAQLRSEKRPDLHSFEMLCNAGLLFNLRNPPLSDVRIRRAIAMAIDRDRLIQHVLDRGDKPSTQILPPILKAMAGYESPQGLGYDPEGARALLAEAGFPSGAGFPKLVYVYNTYEVNRTIAEFIQRSLREELGIAIDIENVEFKTYLTRINSGEFQLARGGVCGIADPAEWVESYRTGATANYGGFTDPEYDALLGQIPGATDRAARNAIIAKAETRLLDAQVMVPFYTPVRWYLLKPFVRGIEAQAMDVHLFKDMSFATE
jgi:oligopeptide transport system substrate-binding protein